MIETLKLILTVTSAVAGAWLSVDHRLDEIDVKLARIETTVQLKLTGK